MISAAFPIRLPIKRIFASSVVALSLSGAFITGAAAESLQVELQRIKDNHPLVKSATENIRVAKEGRTQAFAGYLPSLTVSGTYGYDQISNPTTRGTTTSDYPYSNLSNMSGDVTLSANLFNGFATTHQVRASEYGTEAQTHVREITRAQVFLEGITAYVNVLKSRLLVEEALSNLTNLQTQLADEIQAVEDGGGTEVDAITARQRVHVAENALLFFENTFREDEAVYQQVFGHRPNLVGMEMPQSQRARLPESLDVALDVAQRENPALHALSTAISTLGELKEAAKGGYYPSIDVTATALADHDVDATRGTKREQSIALTATWNLFNGFATRSQVAQASFQQNAIREQRVDIERRVKESTERSWHRMNSSHQRTVVLVKAVNEAELMVTKREEELQGSGRRLDVLDAQTAVHAANIELITAQADALLAEFSLLNDIGRLNMDTIFF